MDEQEARLILQSSRPGEEDRADPQIAEAFAATEQNPELARWLAEEQAFDRAMAAHLAAIPAPFGLRTRLLAQAAPPRPSRWSRWILSLAGAAALLFLLVQVADFWRNAAPASAALPSFASEMVSFVKLDPPLELMSGDLGTIKGWIAKQESPTPQVPPQMAALPPVGCRVLSFREHDVTLICFQRDGKRLAHLFVVDRAALPSVKPGAPPTFNQTGDWATASWAEKDRVYMIAVQGDQATVQGFLPSA